MFWQHFSNVFTALFILCVWIVAELFTISWFVDFSDKRGLHDILSFFGVALIVIFGSALMIAGILTVFAK